MWEGELGIETGVFVGSADRSGLNISRIFADITMVEVISKPPQSECMWSSLGFASEMEFKSVQNRVDPVVSLTSIDALGVD
jgi:hypothetical protein